MRRIAERPRLRRDLGRLNELIISRRFDEALELARSIRARRPDHPDALVAESLCLIHKRRFHDARAVLRGPGWTSALQPLRTYLQATAESGSRRLTDASMSLAECLRMAPEMANEAAMNPYLAALLPIALRAAREA